MRFDNLLSKQVLRERPPLCSCLHGQKTENTPQPLWSMAPFFAAGERLVAGASGKKGGDSANHVNALGADRKTDGQNPHYQAGGYLRGFRPKAAAGGQAQKEMKIMNIYPGATVPYPVRVASAVVPSPVPVPAFSLALLSAPSRIARARHP